MNTINFMQMGVTLSFADIYDYMVEQENQDLAPRKRDILQHFGLGDTKENLKLVASAIAEMKKQGMVTTGYTVNEEGIPCGKGYYRNPDYHGPNRRETDEISTGSNEH